MSQESLESALRRNRRRRDLRAFMDGVGRNLGIDDSVESRLIDLEASDVLEAALDEELDRARREKDAVTIETTERERLSQAAHAFFRSCKGLEFGVLLCHWRHVGGIRLSAADLSHGLLGLLEWDTDTVCGAAEDCAAVFLVDRESSDVRPVVYRGLFWQG